VTGQSRAVRVAAVPLMLFAGAIVAVQSQINGRLAHELGSGARAGIATAVINFVLGILLLTVIVLCLPSARAGVARITVELRHRRLRPYELIGGLFGAYLVTTQGITVGTIGVALFSVAVTAGQSSSSLLVDHLGIGPSGHQPFSVPRAVAATFAVAAVMLAASERLVATFSFETLVFALLPLVAGAGAAVQMALNGRLAAIGGGWAATFNNFVVGMAALLVAFAASLLANGRLDDPPGTWWLYTGGVLGVTLIWLAAVLVKVHGVLVLGLCLIAGQVICAELIELLGPSPHVGIVGVVAGALTVVGVLVALFLRPATRHRERA
jgi:bacterial/archaeal transporter family-2 protein